VGEHPVDGVEVAAGLFVEFLGLLFELLEAPLCIDEDGVFGCFAEVELRFEYLRRL
jgi:hypothetical protein